jgi:hypothetical protein
MTWSIEVGVCWTSGTWDVVGPVSIEEEFFGPLTSDEAEIKAHEMVVKDLASYSQKFLSDQIAHVFTYHITDGPNE